MRSLFRAHNVEGLYVSSWIAVNPPRDILRVTWPWLWGVVGFDAMWHGWRKLPSFHRISEWREGA